MSIKKKISVIGLGYVGLPLAVALSKSFEVVGFDINKSRVKELNAHNDKTLEVAKKELKNANNLKISSNQNDIAGSDIFIATVPTPIDEKNNPDLIALKMASKTIACAIKKGSIVVYESTVYPGCTEEICVPILENFSNLSFNKDFFVGYSPERINPGDKNHAIGDIVKIVSASNKKSLDILHEVYSKIIPAGLHKATSIKVAEAAKIIENTQRDINIALMNEFSLILNELDIDSKEVIEAAGTKWNFHKYSPGLVGGHCIGVDPYYLTYKAKKLGINPRVILSGRKVNDSMHKDVATYLLKNSVNNNKILIL
jgi:UDP-N-acetyl-D-galactosamine dehydrogenase